MTKPETGRNIARSMNCCQTVTLDFFLLMRNVGIRMISAILLQGDEKITLKGDCLETRLSGLDFFYLSANRAKGKVDDGFLIRGFFSSMCSDLN